MESGPAIFAGMVFALFGGVLLLWTVVQVRIGEPVAQGVNQIASATLATTAAMLALGLGTWCFAHV